MKGITPCLWFDTQAEEAARFYTSIFKHARLGSITRYGDAASQAAGRPKGSVLTVEFELAGQKFLALNGGPQFKFSEAVSFIVNCEDQEEIDNYWNQLVAGGQPSECGWLKDKFGLSWQIVPVKLIEMIADKDPARAERVMAAMLQMQKLDLPTLKAAYEGKPVLTRPARPTPAGKPTA